MIRLNKYHIFTYQTVFMLEKKTDPLLFLNAIYSTVYSHPRRWFAKRRNRQRIGRPFFVPSMLFFVFCFFFSNLWSYLIGDQNVFFSMALAYNFFWIMIIKKKSSLIFWPYYNSLHYNPHWAFRTIFLVVNISIIAHAFRSHEWHISD